MECQSRETPKSHRDFQAPSFGILMDDITKMKSLRRKAGGSGLRRKTILFETLWI